MTMEGSGVMPVYDLNNRTTAADGAGFGGGWMWVVMLFFLLAWGGGGFGGFGGGANGAVNTLTNEFLYTNLNNTMNQGFTQLANQGFGIQRDICQSTGALQMGMCQGFNQTNNAIAESRFAAAKLIVTLMLFVQKTTRTLVKSLLRFMQKQKQLVL